MNNLKEKIIIFAIGLLVGAVISTGAFCAYTLTSNNHNCKGKVMQIQKGNPPAMNNNSQGQNNQGGQPPEMPSDNNSQNNTTTEQNNS